MGRMKSHTALTLSLCSCLVVCLGFSLLTSCTPGNDAARPTAQAETAAKPWTTSRVRGTSEPPLPYKLVEAFGGVSFYNPTFIVPMPGTDRYLVGELCGRIYSIRKNAPNEEPELVIDLWEDSPDRPPVPRRGQPQARTDAPLPSEQIYDLAFHPDFENNRQVFISYLFTRRDGEKTFPVWLGRFEFSSIDPPRIDRKSERRLVTTEVSGHAAGCIRFGPDGYLYFSTADGVPPIPPDSLDVGQDITNLYSSILRLDVNREDGEKAYVVPLDNPFLNHKGARPEVWAYGFRNPWKMDFNHETGDLWVADVGWESWEMVHRVVPGGNYGWPVMEGRMPLRSDVTPGPTPIIPPVKDHPRTESHSVTGGVVYTGDRHKELRGWFVYGDYRTGRVWALDTRKSDEYAHRELADSTVRIVAFTQDDAGDIYALDHDFTGKIFRLEATPAPSITEAFPTRLSETGIFASTQKLEPATGVVPYDVTVQPWIDGARAERLVALPGGAKIRTVDVHGKKVWQYPEGTVFVRTLIDPETDRRIETQLLHHEDSQWRHYGYAWNDAQDDAELVGRDGVEHADVVGHAGADLHWRTVSRAECMSCHRPAEGHVLGFLPSQLDRIVSTDSGPKNQLALLKELGVIADAPPKITNLVDPHDVSQDLNERARSYLHVNCGNCHSRDGGSIAFFYLKKQLSLEECKSLVKPSVGGFEMDDPRIIVPGAPARSALLFRMSKLGAGRMPYVGSQVVDSRGLSLMHDWLRSLDPKTEPVSKENSVSLATLKRPDLAAVARDRAVDQLLSTTSGSLALAALLNRGTLPDALKAHIVKKSQSSPLPYVASMFETFVPPAERRERLGPNVKPEDILAVRGDAGRGKLIYMSDSSRCRTCHIPDKSGTRPLGPGLEEIAKKKYSRADMLKHILEPSLAMDPQYTPYVLITSTGDVHASLLLEKTDSEVVIKNAHLDVIRVPTGDVVSLEKQKTSLMPEMLLSDLTAQEAADLLEFLTSLKVGE